MKASNLRRAISVRASWSSPSVVAVTMLTCTPRADAASCVSWQLFRLPQRGFLQQRSYPSRAWSAARRRTNCSCAWSKMIKSFGSSEDFMARGAHSRGREISPSPYPREKRENGRSAPKPLKEQKDNGPSPNLPNLPPLAKRENSGAMSSPIPTISVRPATIPRTSSATFRPSCDGPESD
jgi:hypothetical protein